MLQLEHASARHRLFGDDDARDEREDEQRREALATRMSTSNHAGARARRRVAHDRVVSMGGIKMKMALPRTRARAADEMLLRCAITRSRADDGSNERVDY